MKVSTLVPSFILYRPKLSLDRNHIFVAKPSLANLKSSCFSGLLSKMLSLSCIRGSMIKGQYTHGSEADKFHLLLLSFWSSVDCRWQQNS